MKIATGIIFFLISPVFLQGQDIQFARQIIYTLTSSTMGGRGYVNDGDKKAAAFIAFKFREIKLDSLSNGYFQPFHFPVNIFPGSMKVKINGRELIPGKDYIVDPSSSAALGKYAIIPAESIHSSANDKSFHNKIVLFDKTKQPALKGTMTADEWIRDPQGAAGLLFIEENKLTWGVSTYQLPFPVIHLLRESVPDNPKKISLQIDAQLNENHQTQNIIGLIKGSEIPDSFFVFTAHYDHLGKMGANTYFPGANDNASGTAMLLNLAKYYAAPGHQPKYSMLFISFAGEEAGLLGSQFYTENPVFPLSKIKFLINMDLLGTGDDGMMVVNGDVYRNEFDILSGINSQQQYLKSVGKRGKAKNSDHYYFSEKKVPCFFIYTLGGIKAYHDIYDVSKTLPLTDYEDVFRLIRDFEIALSR